MLFTRYCYGELIKENEMGRHVAGMGVDKCIRK
jgi:hypothetical protein